MPKRKRPAPWFIPAVIVIGSIVIVLLAAMVAIL